jgi:hypothetical protein
MLAMNRRKFLGNSIAAAGGALLVPSSLAAEEARELPGQIPGAVAEPEIEAARSLPPVPAGYCLPTRLNRKSYRFSISMVRCSLRVWARGRGKPAVLVSRRDAHLGTIKAISRLSRREAEEEQKEKQDSIR